MAQELPPGFVLDQPTAPQGPIMGAPRAKSEDKPKDPPSGYRWTANGGLEPIPGGPADPNTKPGGTEKPSQVPVQSEKDARGQVGIYNSLDSAVTGFKDDFGGNPLGGLENFAQAYSPVEVGTPGQREWWAAFQSTDNQIRNDLFGSALTAGEKAAYEQTTISPGMRPDIIRENITRRRDIIRGALTRQRDFMVKNGYRPEAVDAIFAPILQQQEALAAGAGEDKKDDTPPPAFGGTFPPVGPTAGRDDMPTAGAGGENGDVLADPNAEMVQRDNPALAGVRAEYKRRLGAGQSAEQIIEWAKSAGIDPTTYPSIRAQVEDYKRTRRSLSDYNTEQLDDQVVPLSAADRAMNTISQSAPGAFGIAAGDAASMGTLDNIIGATGGNAERARLAMGQISDRRPISSTLGTIAGGATMATGIEGALGLTARGLPSVARTLGADALYGAGTGAGMTDYGDNGAPATVSDRFLGAGKGAAAGGIGSVAGNALGRGLQAVAKGVTNPSVRALDAEGIPMTVGQTFGQSGRIGAAVKGLEDRIAGIPVVGDVVNARRAEGLEKWNSKRFDEALKPINGSVGDKVGEDAVAEAQALVSQAYKDALEGKAVMPDQDFASDMNGALGKAVNIPRVGDEVMTSIVEILRPYDNMPNLSGEAMQTISQELRQLKAGYVNDPLKKRIGAAIDDAEEAIFGMFRRQAPEVVPAYNKANTAYRRLSILQDAVLKGKNTNGVFTPGQLGMTDVANTVKFNGKNAAARGDRPFFDSQRAAQEVLPNKVPDSGTAGRLLIPALALGAGGASDATGVSNGSGLTIGAIMAAAYTRAGQRLLTKSGRGMKGKTGRLLENDKTRRAITAAGASGAVAALPNQR